MESVRKQFTVSKAFTNLHNNYPCLICGVQLKIGDDVTLFINNYTLYPNRVIHTICDSERTDETLTEHWQEAQRYRSWFV